MQKETKEQCFFFGAEFSYFSTEKLGFFWEFFFPSVNSINFCYFFIKNIRQNFNMKKMKKKTLQRRDIYTKA
jgi:hypothetical protein